jgi:AcrR family transcriptional regulator
MGELDRIIGFVREHYEKNGQIPSVRRICREANVTVPWFYRRFSSLEGLVEKAGLKIDKVTLKRIRSTRKATKRRTREKRRQLPKDSNPPAPPTVECEAPEVKAGDMSTQIREDAKREKETHKTHVKNAKQLANTVKELALDDDLEVNSIFLEALNDVIPVVLFHKYGIAASVPDLLAAKDVLRQVDEERKKLDAEEKKNVAERVDIAEAWEKLKRDSDKASLLERVEKLEWEKKVNTNRFNETYEAFKRFRTLFRDVRPIMMKCPNCQEAFMQMMSQDDFFKWLQSMKWARLSFETIDPFRASSRR